MELSDLAGERYVSLTTYRRNGESTATPVWIAGIGDGRIGFTTDEQSLKVTRIRHDHRVLVQPCDMRGRVRAGGVPIEGLATVVPDGEPEAVRARAAIAKKYGIQYRMLIAMRAVRRLLRRPDLPGCAIVISSRGEGER